MIDTTSPHGKLILAVLAALAEFERSMILARTSEGRNRAKARGVRFGRKPKLSQFQVSEALARREAGGALADIGRSYGVSHSTILSSTDMTVNADRILAIIAHLERSGEVEMAADLRSLHIEYEHLRALASQTRVTLREVLDALTGLR